MTDVDHEVGSIRFIVDAPLSSKVAMFNNAASQHKESQLLNPFSEVEGRRSPRPQFSKEEYGRPKAGSLSEARGQKASMHLFKELQELCETINSSGVPVSKQHPDLKVISFGELFNIYVHISNTVVGLLLRARKHKLIDFEGEVLFQRRDDDVPIFMMLTMEEIRNYLRERGNEIRRSTSPNPQTKS